MVFLMFDVFAKDLSHVFKNTFIVHLLLCEQQSHQVIYEFNQCLILVYGDLNIVENILEGLMMSCHGGVSVKDTMLVEAYTNFKLWP